MAKTGNDCPLLAGLRCLGEATPPTDSPRCGVLVPELLKFGLSLGVGGGESRSSWLSRRPTISSGLRALRFELLRVNSRGFMDEPAASRLMVARPGARFVELRLVSPRCRGDVAPRNSIGLLLRLRLRSRPLSLFRSFRIAPFEPSDWASTFVSCWTLWRLNLAFTLG